MYSESKVSERLALARAEFGFTPQYSSVDDVAAFDARLRREGKYTLDEFGQPASTTNLSPADRDYMLNEQALVMCDHAYAITRYCFVKDETGVISRFNFRVPQRILFEIIAELEDMNAAIEILSLKARQLGVSTLIELLIGLRIIFSYGVNAVIGSADQGMTGRMASMLFLMYDMLPCWLRPQWTRRVESDHGMLQFGHQATSVSFQHGSQKQGIGTGTTPTLYHLCISGRTLIRTRDSQVAMMRELRVGDAVISLSGIPVGIKATCVSPRTREMTSEIQVWGTPSPLSCTRDHKVLTESGWKHARDIGHADWLIYPVRPITHLVTSVDINHFEKWKKSQSGLRTIPAGFELGRLAGLYLAEGCIFRSKQKTSKVVGFSIHRKEVETVESWIRSVFSEHDGIAQRRKTSKTAIVTLRNRGFADWLINNFGEKDSKRVPDLCWKLGREFCRGMVQGYLAGDGHFPPAANEVYATSVRVAISLGMRELMASLGYGWSSVSFREAGQWYNRNCRACWMLVVAGDTAVNLRRDFGYPTKISKRPQPPLHWHWTTTGNLAIQVESVSDGFSEDFYDIEVDDSDHAFLAVSGIVHNSEVALYEAAGGRDRTVALIDEGLWKAVHASPNVFGVLESTGRGDTGWWADTWNYSIERWEERKCRMCPIFLPWFCGRDIYPTPTWLSTRPVPSGWMPNRDTRQHIAKAELYVRSHPRIERHLLADQERRGERRHQQWKMPLAQQWFWEVGHEEAKFKGKQSSWYQEMAGDDIEALQRSGGEPVFGHDVIAEITSSLQPTYDVYGISGQSIESDHEPLPDYIDYHRPRIPLRYQSRRGESYRWDLIPMRFGQPEPHGLPALDPRNAEDPEGLLIVWQPPQPNVAYSIGVDTSEGRGMDSTVISVWALGWGDTPDTQVAEFTSSYVSHVEAFSFVLAIATYYARHMSPETTRWKEPYVAVEQVAAVGDVCQAQMARMGYSNFHRMIRYDKKNLAKLKKQSRNMGWFSYGWSRPILIGHFVHWAKNHWASINSPWLLDEMKHFEVHYTSGGKERMEHEDDYHDDRIFAAAMSIFCPHDMDKMAQRSKKRIVETDAGGLPKLDLTPHAGLVIPAAQLHRPEKFLDSLERLQYSTGRRAR